MPTYLTLTLSVLMTVICVPCCVPCWADDGTISRESLLQAVADAEKHFDSLSSKDTPEAIEAKQAVIACKREALLYLVERKKAEDATAIRREVRSLFAATAWVANQREMRQEYKEGLSEWAGFTDCCKQALGIDSPEYRKAAENADVMSCKANAAPSTIQAYLKNRSELKNAFAQKDWETAFELALKDYEYCREIFGELMPATIKSLGNVEAVSLSPKRIAQFFELFEDAIARGEKLYPASHPALANSIRNLGSRYEARNLLEKAESTYRRAEPSLQHWSCLVRLATKHRKAGQHQHALRLYEDVFTHCGETIGDNHPLRGLAGTYSGDTCRNLGNYQQALDRLNTSVQIWDANSNKFEVANCLNSIALTQQLAGQRDAAESSFQKAVKLLDDSEKGRGFQMRMAFEANYVSLLQETGKYQQVVDRLNTCKQIWETQSNKFELANCLNTIALAQQHLSEHDAAEFSYQQASKLLVDDETPKGLELRKFTEANYASLLEETGRVPEAMKIYEKITNERDADATLSPADLDAREKLALLYQKIQEFAKAETLLDSLLQYRDRPARKISQLHSMRGRFYIDVGALDKADEELDAALSYLDADDTTIDVATVQNLKAIVLLQRDQPAAALAKYEGVLDSLIKSFGPTHVRCAAIYDQIAKVQRKLGNYSEATAAHRKAIIIYESTYGATHVWVAWAHHRLGTTHFVFNSPDDACNAWRRSFEIKQDICHKTLPWLPEAQASAFLTSLTSNDSSAGRDTLLSTLSVDMVGNAEEAFHCVWRSRGLVLNAIANRERQLASTKRSPERAQLAKIRRRLAQLSIQAGSEDSAHRAARTKLLRELSEEKESLERIIAERALSKLANNETDAQLDGVTPNDLMDRLPAHAALVQLVRTERWQPTEKGTTDVVKKMVYDAFVVSREAVTDDSSNQQRLKFHWVELGDAAQIDDHITTWRKAILRGDGGTRGKRVGKSSVKPDVKSAQVSREELHKRVWKPISSALGSRSRVIIVPDGDFHRMPWIALPGNEADYLIEEVQITTAADGRQLAQLLQSIESAAPENTNPEQRSEKFLLIGGVEYNAQLPKPEGGQTAQARETSWPFLKGTREEIAAIGKVIPTEKTNVLLGEHAMEEIVKSEFEKAAVIHIATHGYFSDDLDEDLTNDSARGEAQGPRQTSTTLTARNPLLQCGLTLAGCNSDVWLDADGLPIDNGQDGYLSAEEIMGMDLGSARLVVLSACETGLGSIGSGEGVFGLQRALHISGVKSTIASGWKVDDRATQLLMTEMYHQMFDQELSAADALHAAQLRVLRHFNPTTGQLDESNSKPAPPYYWAAFSLSGAL